MSSSYEDIVIGFRLERQSLKLSQRSLSKKTAIAQSHYHLVEKGKEMLSFQQMKELLVLGIDIHKIYTERICSARYLGLLGNKNYLELTALLVALYSLLSYEPGGIKRQNSVLKELGYIPLLLEVQNSKEILSTYRKRNQYLQETMANDLGINIKTLRKIEKGSSQPDSEMLFNIYSAYKIPPSVFLRDKRGVMADISVMLNVVGGENAERFLKLAEDISASKFH